ncbi:MAG: hypothetical protein SFT68_01695, partial [Rickettsiaceae bacterium]|nr:hypothetical protein [Rickettsiaceae bacterium]
MAQHNINSDFKSSLVCKGVNFTIVDLNLVCSKEGINLSKLPYSMRILLENAVRGGASGASLAPFKNWGTANFVAEELDFYP